MVPSLMRFGNPSILTPCVGVLFCWFFLTAKIHMCVCTKLCLLMFLWHLLLQKCMSVKSKIVPKRVKKHFPDSSLLLVMIKTAIFGIPVGPCQVFPNYSNVFIFPIIFLIQMSKFDPFLMLLI